MDEPIVVVDANREQCQELCTILEERNYRAASVYTVQNLEKYLLEDACLMVILDLNTLPIDNHVIRQLTITNPGVYFFGLSEKRLNPEFEESICYHIYACLNKPVDMDELLYWIESVCEEESKPDLMRLGGSKMFLGC